jgi:hypothetical protein
MVEFCEVKKYRVSDRPNEFEEYFMFYDTISDHPIYFNGEFLFKNEEEFLFWAEDNNELERYTGKILSKFKKNK